MSRNRQILLDDETTSAENQAPQAWVLAPGQQVGSALPLAPQLLAQLQHNDQHSIPQLPVEIERMGRTGPQSRPQIHPPPPPHTGRQAARMGCEAGTEGAPRGKGRGEGEGQG